MNSFHVGFRDGVSVGLGYLSVAFAFGIIATGSGLSIFETVLVSMLNFTSAGQIAAVPILVNLGSIVELILTQIVLNARYGLMSTSLSQRIVPEVRTGELIIVGGFISDEVFAVTMSKHVSVGKRYLFGLIFPPYIAWTLGTLLGALLGNILPTLLTNALGIALYAMFIAIIIPEARGRGKTAICILISAMLSCLFYFTPVLQDITSGFTIIIISVAVSLVFALICPIEEKAEVE